MAKRGRRHGLPKDIRLYVSLWENDPASHLISHVSKQFPVEFMVTVPTFKSSSIQHDVHLVNYGKTDDKVGYDLGCGHLVIDMLLPWRVLGVLSQIRWCMVTAIPDSKLQNGGPQSNGWCHSGSAQYLLYSLWFRRIFECVMLIAANVALSC